MDIQVGDRVYWKYINEEENFIYINIVTSISDKDCINQGDRIILKIERPHYEVIEEKKELLTEEEKEFLKDMCKYYNIIKIYFCEDSIDFYDNDCIVNCPDYPHNIKFKNVEKHRYYTLEELGLEEN